MNITIGEIEKRYGVDLGVPLDTTLIEYLEQEGYPSLAEVLKSIEKNIDE